MISPLEGFRHCAVEIINEFKDALFELSLTCETGTSEEFTHQNAEPHFNLIKPGTVNVSEMKDYLMIGVIQEGGAGLQREREYPIHL